MLKKTIIFAIMVTLIPMTLLAKNKSAPTKDRPAFEVSGFSEVIFSVSDINQHRDFLSAIGGYQAAKEVDISAQARQVWQLPAEAKASEVLMKNPGTERGFIRLVKFSGVEQQQIRSNTQSWDTGGIFDINMRVLDMDKKFKQMQSLGWQSASDPIQFTFGPFVVKEWIVTGPDGITFALIERIKPELKGWPHIKEFSRVFNSTQTVQDIESSKHFYQQVLGFKTYLKHRGTSKTESANVLGLPYNLTTKIDRSVFILHPTGVNEGSVEILQFHGATGKDVAPLAQAPNLGILTLRFPVKGLGALATQLEKHKIEIVNRIQGVELAPYGNVDLLVVKSPDGTLLEFYEVNSPAN